MEIEKTDGNSMSLAEMRELAEEIGEKSFRGEQVFQWIQRGELLFENMKNLPKGTRDNFDKHVKLFPLVPLKVEKSKKDGTWKILYQLEDGNKVETVLMKYKHGYSLCISSQVGCNMNCSFCASAIGGKVRDLTAGEMVRQIIGTEEISGQKVSNVVVMGIGEPFDNMENLKKFLRIIHEPKGRNMGYRNFTVSTCGLADEIVIFGREFPQVNLAVSLHSANNELRRKLMPIGQVYSLDEIMEACTTYFAETGRRVTFEYGLMSGVNDSKDDIEQLIGLISGMNCHVNLIPINDVAERRYAATSQKRAMEISETISKRGINCTVRRQLGNDISAACGQLRNSLE